MSIAFLTTQTDDLPTPAPPTPPAGRLSGQTHYLITIAAHSWYPTHEQLNSSQFRILLLQLYCTSYEYVVYYVWGRSNELVELSELNMLHVAALKNNGTHGFFVFLPCTMFKVVL